MIHKQNKNIIKEIETIKTTKQNSGVKEYNNKLKNCIIDSVISKLVQAKESAYVKTGHLKISTQRSKQK